MNKEDIIKYINKKYDALEEHPWEKYPEDITFKHKDNLKWFALIMKVSYRKLKIDKDGDVEVINLKNMPEIIGGLRKENGILPGYHMNKEHWITILLDGTANKERIYELIEMSYELTMKKKK